MICEEMQYAGTQTDALGIYAVFMSVGDYPSTFFCPFNEELKKYLIRSQEKRVFVNVTARETVVTDLVGKVLAKVSR